MLATLGRGRGPAEPCHPRSGCGEPPYGLAVRLMVFSRRSLAQWRHAGHNRRARGARRRGDPRRVRGVRGPRGRPRGRLAPGRAPAVLGDRPGRIPAPARTNRVVWWLVGVGVAFGCDVALGDVFLPMAENHWGATSSITAAIALLDHWFAVAGPVAGVGLVGLFPSGRPERAYERVVIWTVALAGFLLPLLEAVSGANIAPAGGPPDGVPPVLYRALYVPALAPLGGAAEAVYRTFPVWPLIGVALLALRYRRTDGAQRRQIRWLLLGMAASLSLWIPLALLWQLADPDNAAASGARARCCPRLALATTLGSMLVALFYTGVFGIDEPARRAFVHRVLRVSIAVVLAAPGDPGRRADQPGRAGRRRRGGRRGRRGRGPGRSAPSGARRRPLGARRAAGRLRQPQPLRREPDPGARLRRAAARPGRRDPPRPGPDLGPGIAGTRRTGRLRVVTDGTPARRAGRDRAHRIPRAPSSDASSAARVPTARCWPRTAGCWPTSPPRPRWACTTSTWPRSSPGASRRSGTRRPNWPRPGARGGGPGRRAPPDPAVLHDGVQQEIVALSAKAGLVRQQLLRGDPAAADGLAEMQRDLATTLQDVREIAYAIHPPVLSDRGLLEAIEAQSSRLAVPMAVRADPRPARRAVRRADRGDRLVRAGRGAVERGQARRGQRGRGVAEPGRTAGSGW